MTTSSHCLVIVWWGGGGGRSVAADYDLTGQLVWPGAGILNDYLVNHSDILDGRSVIELGSGVGKKTSTISFIVLQELCFFSLASLYSL